MTFPITHTHTDKYTNTHTHLTFHTALGRGPASEPFVLSFVYRFVPAVLGGPLPANSGLFYEESVLGSGSRQPQQHTLWCSVARRELQCAPSTIYLLFVQGRPLNAKPKRPTKLAGPPKSATTSPPSPFSPPPPPPPLPSSQPLLRKSPEGSRCQAFQLFKQVSGWCRGGGGGQLYHRGDLDCWFVQPPLPP